MRPRPGKFFFYKTIAQTFTYILLIPKGSEGTTSVHSGAGGPAACDSYTWKQMSRWMLFVIQDYHEHYSECNQKYQLTL